MLSLLFLQVGVSIQLSSSGLTKIVTFTPFFMLVNQAPVSKYKRSFSNYGQKWSMSLQKSFVFCNSNSNRTFIALNIYIKSDSEVQSHESQYTYMLLIYFTLKSRHVGLGWHRGEVNSYCLCYSMLWPVGKWTWRRTNGGSWNLGMWVKSASYLNGHVVYICIFHTSQTYTSS